jgi:hypothetical protein
MTRVMLVAFQTNEDAALPGREPAKQDLEGQRQSAPKDADAE